jgi:hypothetical protein
VVEGTVTVYEYESLDAARHRWRRADRRGTLEAIASVGGVPLRSTGLVVDASRLDEDGFIVTTRPAVE